MTKTFFSFVTFMLFNTFIFGQSAIYDTSIGSSLTVIDNYLTENIEKGVIPGGVFLVAEKGKIKYFKSFGYDNQSMNKPYENDNIFRIASMTKSLTVVSILQLMEKGKLDLDDPLSKYIPSFKKTMVLDRFNSSDSSYTTVNQKKEITIRNLLTHTSGIYYGSFEKDSLRAVYTKNELMIFGLSTDQFTTEEMVNKIAAAPLAFQPGTHYKYGMNMEVLGRVIEVVSKTSLDKYFSENISGPLGMKDTYFYLPKEKQDRLAKVHASDTVQNIINYPFLEYPKMPAHNHFAGGGGLSSTTLDYATLCMALANEGSLNKKRILKKKTVKLLSEPEFTELDNNNTGFMSNVEEMGFGLGYWVVKKENSAMSPLSKGSFGWGGYFNTKYYIDPKKDIVIVGMTQMFGFNNQPFWQELNKVIYNAID
ncbi:serine hydrolase domain-containing protein [Lutimonas halocynthiae]|uniref:serine hydrolase domain-containing protein n=1 Tax=Lutimonas halocynthiae TaxID=1446477 RepID=UPI0025B51736|nr:serine hydrolase domain-containing protein [Lutimonas halocynthiae]MDN3641604.1 serine hydrolase domain-containing protein [Lutimonas halocynthiae]